MRLEHRIRTSVALRTGLRLTRNGFRRGLQYRGAHMVNNAASAIFGVVFIAIWRSVLSGSAGRRAAAPLHLSVAWTAHYVVASQSLLWITVFLPFGLGLPEAVRNGQVVADLTRPVGLWALHMGREAGGAAYNLVYRSLPVAAGLGLMVGLPRPQTLLGVVAALALTAVAVWNALCLNYLVGISAFWTTEARAAHNLLVALVFALGCAEVPLRAFPAPLRPILVWLPFGSLLSTPALAWMGSVGLPAVVAAVAWALTLSAVCILATRAARRRLAVQGG